MAHEQLTERDAPSVPQDGLEVLALALRHVYTDEIVDVCRGITYTFPTGAHDLNAYQVGRFLEERGFALVKKGGLSSGGSEPPLGEEFARKDERRVLAATLEKTRLDAVNAFRELTSAGGEAWEDAMVILQAKHLDELAVRLARGER